MAVSGNFAREGLKELILHRMVSPFHELLGFTDSGSDKVEWISTNAGTPRARMWCSELDGCLRHLCDHRDSNLLGRYRSYNYPEDYKPLRIIADTRYHFRYVAKPMSGAHLPLTGIQLLSSRDRMS